MNEAMNTLTTTVTSDALWGVFNSAIPYISIAVLVSFGFFIVRRVIKGISKGKTKI